MTPAAVVVCVHRVERVPLLVEALKSLRAQELPPVEVVVVVDGGEDVLAAVRTAVPDTRTIWTGGGRGLSAARNSGVGQLAADVVGFLDDDAVAEPGWLGRLVAAFSDPAVLGASGTSLPRWESAPPGWMPPELLWTVGCSYRGMPRERGPVRNFFGGCGVVRRDVFEALGGFDTALGRQASGVAGGEEAEFCARALAAYPNGSFVFEPSAVIHHFVPDARARPGYVIRRCWADGKAKALLLVASGPAALGPERRFIKRALGAVLRAGSWRGGAPPARPLQIAVLAGGVLAAACGCLVALPAAVLTLPSRRPGGHRT